MQQHGDFSMQCEGRIIICRPVGAFNLQGAMAYEPVFMQSALQLKDAPWGILEVAKDFEAGIPEVIARFRNQFIWCAQHNCQYLAVILDGHYKKFFADQIFRDLPMQAVKYFKDENEGKEWLNACLAAQ